MAENLFREYDFSSLSVKKRAAIGSEQKYDLNPYLVSDKL
jgi:hypothetical protein